MRMLLLLLLLLLLLHRPTPLLHPLQGEEEREQKRRFPPHRDVALQS